MNKGTGVFWRSLLSRIKLHVCLQCEYTDVVTISKSIALHHINVGPQRRISWLLCSVYWRVYQLPLLLAEHLQSQEGHFMFTSRFTTDIICNQVNYKHRSKYCSAVIEPNTVLATHHSKLMAVHGAHKERVQDAHNQASPQRIG